MASVRGHSNLENVDDRVATTFSNKLDKALKGAWLTLTNSL